IDVLSNATLQRQGTTELGAALSAVVPSIDFPRSSAVDGTDSIRPATLRGLSPDQTLVLINGVRAHTSALLNTNGSVGRGSAAVDLNTIPSVALERIEVLRDGAAAQYGSDAIAGVVNLRLREARSGGGATVTYGQYITDVVTARGRRNEHDGQT
ncbi:TonB-dependent receptor plug domain-containing protein, partial [Bradyrhizobium sp. 18BD]